MKHKIRNKFKGWRKYLSYRKQKWIKLNCDDKKYSCDWLVNESAAMCKNDIACFSHPHTHPHPHP